MKVDELHRVKMRTIVLDEVPVVLHFFVILVLLVISDVFVVLVLKPIVLLLRGTVIVELTYLESVLEELVDNHDDVGHEVLLLRP